MKRRRLLPVLCLAAGLLFCVPMNAHATGIDTVPETETETETETEAPVLQDGWDATKSYYIKDGEKVKGAVLIDNVLYAFNPETGQLITGREDVLVLGSIRYFVHSNGTIDTRGSMFASPANPSAVYYSHPDGHLAFNQSVKVGKYIYVFGEDAKKLTSGIHTVNGRSYLLTRTGRAYTGWRKYHGKYYFMDNNGVMTVNGTAKKGTSLRYLGKDGAMKTGRFTSNGKSYYADEKGNLKTGWVQYNGKWYYYHKKTAVMLKNCILRNNGRYYHFGRKGRMSTGWVNFNGKRYYASKSGSFLTGIEYVGGKRYLFSSKKGILLTDKWVKKGGKWYYGDKKGILATGWKRIENKWYYFEGTGIMRTGWMADNSKFYYLDPKTGEMAVGKKVIDGETYHFDASGASDKLPAGPWAIRVNRMMNVVTIYKGNVPVKAILCSTGRNNATPVGTFRIMDKLYLHELDGPTWGYYCSHITPEILFHSIPAPSKDRWNVPSYYFNALGTQASAGCIRLAMGDAYWIYTNVPVGTPVTVYDSPNPGPLGKPTPIKMPTYPVYSYDPTDPTR